MAGWLRSSGSVLLAIGVVTVMSGCGADTPATGSSGSANGTTASVPVSSAPAPTSAPGSTPPKIAKGDMYVRLGADHYAAGESVHVTVNNGMEWPVYTTDFKTACSIVTLQRQDGGTWTDLTGCKMGRPTQVVTIAAGQEPAVDIDPHSVHLGGSTEKLAFAAGTYRVMFTYRTDSAMNSGESQVAYSPEFTIS